MFGRKSERDSRLYGVSTWAECGIQIAREAQGLNRGSPWRGGIRYKCGRSPGNSGGYVDNSKMCDTPCAGANAHEVFFYLRFLHNFYLVETSDLFTTIWSVEVPILLEWSRAVCILMYI